jgi:hypothetical protein
MLFLSYFIRLFAPVINPMGVIGFIFYLLYMMDYWLYNEPFLKHNPQFPVEILGKISFDIGFLIFGISILAFILGILFGVKAYRNDIPFNGLWTKSNNELLSVSISTTLKYAFSFFAYPYAIFLVHFCIVYFQTMH